MNFREDSEVGSVVTTLRAVDIDTGDNAKINYSMVNEPGTVRFCFANLGDSPLSGSIDRTGSH